MFKSDGAFDWSDQDPSKERDREWKVRVRTNSLYRIVSLVKLGKIIEEISATQLLGFIEASKLETLERIKAFTNQ